MNLEADKEEVRCFIAVEISARQQKNLWKQCHDWRLRYDRFRWATPDSYHLTLAFLGNQPQIVLPRLTRQLRFALEPVATITVHIDRLELFPRRRPHVVAARIVPAPLLTSLYQRVHEACGACGIDLPHPERSFHPHITVARFRRQSFHDLSSPLELDLTIPVNSVVLFSSELRREGAVHRVVERVQLERG